MSFPTFRRPALPRAVLATPAPRYRSSPRGRGYGSKWDRLSKGHRKVNPWCQRCLDHGERVLCDVADHKVPVADGGPILDPTNIVSLCNSCHNGWKRSLEDAARALGDIYILKTWCDEPSSRPARLR